MRAQVTGNSVNSQLTEPRLAPALQLIQEWIGDGVVPGASVAVFRHSTVLAELHVGTADLRHNAAVSPATIWGVASITKPVTAAAVVAVVESGRVSLDEPIMRIVPE